MQDSAAEDNRAAAPAWCAPLAAAAAAIAAAVVLMLRWHGAPTPTALVLADAGWHERLQAAVLAACGSAAIVAVVMAVLPSLRRQGVLAAIATPMFAGGATVLVAGWAWVSPPLPAWSVAVAAAGLALASSPLLRERGFGSLLLVPAVAASPVLWSLRQARADALAAAPVAGLQAAAARLGEPAGPVALLLGSGVAPLAQELVVRALRRPFWPYDLDLLCGAEPGPAAAWLQRLSLPRLRRTERGFEADRSARSLPRRQAPPWQPELSVGDAGVAVLVRASEPVVGVLFTPLGDVELVADPTGGGDARLRPVPADAERVRGWLQAMPPGSLIRALVVSRDAADAYGWIDQRLAGDRPR